MGSPGELTGNNAKYLVLTLQSIDEKVFEIVKKMGFGAVLTTTKILRSGWSTRTMCRRY